MKKTRMAAEGNCQEEPRETGLSNAESGGGGNARDGWRHRAHGTEAGAEGHVWELSTDRTKEVEIRGRSAREVGREQAECGGRNSTATHSASRGRSGLGEGSGTCACRKPGQERGKATR